MKLNKKIAVAFPAAALAIMGSASGAAAASGGDDGEDFTINLANCIAADVINVPILSDDDNSVDCSQESEYTSFGLYKMLPIHR